MNFETGEEDGSGWGGLVPTAAEKRTQSARRNKVAIDPTYVKSQIENNPAWDLAFTLSEILNDDAPIGWSRYISTAKCLLAHYKIEHKEQEHA